MKKEAVTPQKLSPPAPGQADSPHQKRSPLQALGASPLLQLVLIALVGMLAYSNTLQVPFVIDDESSIVRNPVVKNLSSFLFDGAGYSYNPRRVVGYLTLTLNYHLGGLDVTGYHIFNTAVHLANAALVFVLLRLTLRTPLFRDAAGQSSTPALEEDPQGLRFVPLITALLFVSHPLQTQAVTYVVQRLASLAALFYLCSLACYILARLRQEKSGRLFDAKSALCYFGALLAAVLAMKTKEICFTLPMAVVLYEFSFFGASFRKRLIFLLPIAVTLAIVPLGLMRSGKPLGELLGEMSAMARETETISRGDYLLTQFSVIATYLRLTVLPINQNLDYDYPVYHTLFAPKVFASFLLLASLVALALYLYRRSARGKGDGGAAAEPRLRLAAFGIFWFFITLAVESSVIPIRDVIFEHRAYLPSVGIFLALAALGVPLAGALKPRSAAVAVGAVVLVLSMVTWQRNLVWGSAVRLWQDTAEKSPEKVRPRNNLATALMAQGRVDEAIAQLEVALKLKPTNPDALRNLGAAYELKGGVDQAIAQYEVALLANPNNKYAHYNLGVSFNKKGLQDRAMAEFLLAVKLDPGYADAHNNLGVIFGNKGMMEEAIGKFQLATKLDPGSAEAHKNLGLALDKSGRAEEALAELRIAAALQPGNAEVYNSMGIVYAGQQRFQEAAEQFRKAASLKPDDPRYLNNLYRLNQ